MLLFFLQLYNLIMVPKEQILKQKLKSPVLLLILKYKNVPLKEISSSKNAQDGPSVNVANKCSTCSCQMHVNAFGQVKTARNTKRPKPPLPPMKKKKDKPTRFRQRLKSKQNEPNKVFRYMPLFNIYFYYLNVTCSLSL